MEWGGGGVQDRKMWVIGINVKSVDKTKLLAVYCNITLVLLCLKSPETPVFVEQLLCGLYGPRCPLFEKGR